MEFPGIVKRVRANAGGFSLVELLVATVVSLMVLGGAVMLTSQMQNGYRRQLEGSTGEQEARYALDWMGRLIRGAGNNPFVVAFGPCPTDPTAFEGIRFDPNGDGIDNDIRLQSDSNPPDRQVGGTAGACDQANEDVTISHDADNHVILFTDNNLGGGASIRTDSVIEDLRFIYRDSTRTQMLPAPGTADRIAVNVFYVEIQITLRPRTGNPNGQATPRVLTSEVLVRSRAS